VIVGEEHGPIERLRPLAQAIAAMPQAVFIGWSADPPALLLASSPDSGVDAGTALRSVLEKVGGRGGGNARLAQGTAASAAAVEQAAALLGSGA
jgi:alanyl-tRNA synthetase